MTPKDIANQLANRAEEVAKTLLPGGKRSGNDWIAGSTSGESGESLKVAMQGDKAGIWADFASDDAGDLLDLWCAAKGVNLAEAIQEAKAFLGIQDPSWERPKKQYTKPPKPKCSAPANQELRWLTETRKLSEAAITAYQIGTQPGKIILPFKRGPEREAEMPMCKWRSITDKTTQPTSKDQMPCLFGWQAVPADAREVTLCEGEFDAMALYDYGHPALSVPFGGGSGAKQQWIDNEWEALEQFDVIYVAMDTDGPGKDAAKAIIDRLGRERCRLVNLPEKDANDCLKAEIPSHLIDKCFRNSLYLDPSDLKSAADYADDIYYSIYPDEAPGDNRAIEPPWDRAAQMIRFRPHELMLLNGVNGHGKSQLAGYLTLNAMRDGAKACIASMEIQPGQLLGNMALQATGTGKPTKGFISAVTDWYRNRAWVFEQLGTAKADRIIEVFQYAYKRYGITWFVIDSLMKCGIAEDDYNGQKAFMEKLCDFKNEHPVFVCLVTHARKGESENKPTGKFDVKGTSAITDLPDTVTIVWRNKPKEEILRKHEQQVEVLSDDEYEDARNRPDVIWSIVKQRSPQGQEGKVSLWFDPHSLQYRAGPDAKPFQFVQYSGPSEVAA